MQRGTRCSLTSPCPQRKTILVIRRKVERASGTGRKEGRQCGTLPKAHTRPHFVHHAGVRNRAGSSVTRVPLSRGAAGLRFFRLRVPSTLRSTRGITSQDPRRNHERRRFLPWYTSTLQLTRCVRAFGLRGRRKFVERRKDSSLVFLQDYFKLLVARLEISIDRNVEFKCDVKTLNKNFEFEYDNNNNDRKYDNDEIELTRNPANQKISVPRKFKASLDYSRTDSLYDLINL